jgi:hypothetical protein
MIIGIWQLLLFDLLQYSRILRDNKMLPYISIHKLFKSAAVEFSEQAKRWMPEWLTEHPALRAVKNTRVFKVFSVFGLNDFRQSFEDPSAIENFTDLLTNQLSRVVKELIRVPDSPEATELEQVAYRLLQEVVKPEVWASDRHRILVGVSSDNKKFRIDAGTTVIKAYNAVKVKAVRFGIVLPELETTREFKDYSKRGKMTVVFSTNPEDVAAMSSRSEWGSCQTVDTTKGLNACVVGSLMSKFIGICYITSGKPYQERGESMVARSLVRFVIDTRNNKPVIYLDKMYPAHYPMFMDMMIKAIQSRTQVPVVDSSKLRISEEFGRYRVPKEKIKSLPEHEQSYIDEPEYFSTKSEEADETMPVKNANAFFLNYADTVGALLGGSIAHYITSNIEVDREQESTLRTEAIGFGRQLVRTFIRPMKEKILAHYDKRFKPGWQPMPLGFLKKLMFRALSQQNVSDIYQLIDYYQQKGDPQHPPSALARVIDRGNLARELAAFIKNAAEEISKQVVI